MPSAADVAFLDRALTDLETVRKWTPRTISKLEALINSDDPWALYRVDPIRFANARGIAEQEAVDLFLHASRLGLFEMEWRLLCPACSDTVTSCNSITTLNSRCYCHLCAYDAPAALDEFIVISFNLSRRVRELPWHKPESLASHDLYFRYRLDPYAEAEGYGKFVDMMLGFKKFITYLEPAAGTSGKFNLEHGDWLIVYDYFHNKTCVAQALNKPGLPSKLQLERTTDGWTGLPDEVAAGKVDMSIKYDGGQRTGVLVFAHPDHPPITLKLGNYLSGNRLINNQTYRTLFRAETLASGEGIGVRDLTLLFTDLKGSTELYERVGDLEAFSLVQQHFEHLRRAVQEQEGAVIKTIGDAVMASFVKPEQAVRAALAMFREIEAFNNARGKRELILKIGLHRGHSIAVTLNERLDYFGQTVNIAARVQGVAHADEICLTEDVFALEPVKQALTGLEAVPENAQLKGIQGSVPIRRVRVR